MPDPDDVLLGVTPMPEQTDNGPRPEDGDQPDPDATGQRYDLIGDDEPWPSS